MAQRKARTGRTAKTKSRPAGKQRAKKATRARKKAPARAAGTAAASAQRRMIEALRAENRRLRDELAALRAERATPAPADEVPALALGDRAADRI